jgi:hypothetical protein
MEYQPVLLTRRTKLRALFGGTAAGALALAPQLSRTALADHSPFHGIPISGPLPGIVGGTFTGTLDVTRFEVEDGQLVATGTLTGQLLDALGNVIGTVTDAPVQLPVTELNGTCEILHLELGPLDLNLLGLVVHLDRVVLDISAAPGAGNLLGNLLCGIAGLLDRDGPLQGVAGLLNNLLRQLGRG